MTPTRTLDEEIGFCGRVLMGRVERRGGEWMEKR